MDQIIKVFQTQIKGYDPKTRSLHMIASTETTDRDGDVIDIGGWKLDKYLKHPVIMFAHDYSELPVGKCTAIQVKDGNLEMDVTLAGTDMADEIDKYLAGGFPLAASVGFSPIKSEPIYSEGNPQMRTGNHYIEQDLNEVSLCAIPSNPDAVVQLRSMGKERDDLRKKVDELIEICKSEKTPPAVDLTSIEKRFAEIELKMIALESWQKSPANKEPETETPGGQKPEAAKPESQPPAPAVKVVTPSAFQIAMLAKKTAEKEIKRAQGAIPGGNL
jgi:HK97 family phage prohead protease